MLLISENGEWHFDEQLLLHIRQKNNDEVRSILTSDDLCKLTDSNKSTLLHFAAEYGNANITQHLIDSGVNVNSRDKSGRTPLLLAVTRSRAQLSAETINVLLEAKADFLKPDIDGEYPLRRVVDNRTFGKLSVVKKFFRRLAEYCMDDSQLMSELLIKANCPLERAIYLANASVTEAMIRAGYAVDEIHPRLGHTPLHVAATVMDLENVRVLIRHGADVTARIGERLLPLSLYFIAGKYRAHRPEPRIMELLVSQYFGAGDRAEDVALSLKHALQLGDEQAIGHMLQFQQLDLGGVRGSQENCALHYLAMNDNPHVARAFESRIADVNARNRRGCTPLHYAAVSRNASTLRVFLEHGANVNEKSHIGNTPLSALFFTLSERHYAHEREVVQILLQHNADVQVIIPETRDTIFDYVVRHERFDLGELLLAKLAFREKLGEPVLDLIRAKIEAQRRLKQHYDLCVRQLEQMQSIVIYESITLFKLLGQNEKEMVRRYVYNEELLQELQNFTTKYWLNSYYCHTLRDRIASALPKITLVQGVTGVIFHLIGPQLKRNYLVVRRIIDYLSYEDMRVLNSIKMSEYY